MSSCKKKKMLYNRNYRFFFLFFAFGLFNLPIRVIGRICMWTVTLWSTLLPWVPQAVHASWQNDTIPVVSSLINQTCVEKGGTRNVFITAETGKARTYQSCAVKAGNPTDLSARLCQRGTALRQHARLGPSCPSECLRGRWSVCERGCSKFQEKLDCWYSSEPHWAAVLPTWRAFMGRRSWYSVRPEEVGVWWETFEGLWFTENSITEARGQCAHILMFWLFFQILLFWLTSEKNRVAAFGWRDYWWNLDDGVNRSVASQARVQRVL